MSKGHFGLIGLGVMGENLVLNAESNGFSSVVYNRTREKTDDFMAGRGAGKQIQPAYSLQEFVDKLVYCKEFNTKIVPDIDVTTNENFRGLLFSVY